MKALRNKLFVSNIYYLLLNKFEKKKSSVSSPDPRFLLNILFSSSNLCHKLFYPNRSNLCFSSNDTDDSSVHQNFSSMLLFFSISSKFYLNKNGFEKSSYLITMKRGKFTECGPHFSSSKNFFSHWINFGREKFYSRFQPDYYLGDVEGLVKIS